MNYSYLLYYFRIIGSLLITTAYHQLSLSLHTFLYLFVNYINLKSKYSCAFHNKVFGCSFPGSLLKVAAAEALFHLTSVLWLKTQETVIQYL